MTMKIDKKMFTDGMTIGEYFANLKKEDKVACDWEKFFEPYIGKCFNRYTSYYKIVKTTYDGVIVDIVHFEKERHEYYCCTRTFGNFAKVIIMEGTEITQEEYDSIKNKTKDLVSYILAKIDVDVNDCTPIFQMPYLLWRSETNILKIDLPIVESFTLKEYKKFVKEQNKKSKETIEQCIKTINEQYLNKSIVCHNPNSIIEKIRCGTITNVDYEIDNHVFNIVVNFDSIKPDNFGFKKYGMCFHIDKIYKVFNNNLFDEIESF